MSGQEVIAYCLKCREKRTMQNPEPVFTATGNPATRGTCPVCGATLFKMGRTQAHAALPTPSRNAQAERAMQPA
ncbi:MAG: DUF5679 domain-containing protein, partial [Anaerolineae bacterium]